MQCNFQSHNKFGEQVAKEQNSQQVLMLLSERQISITFLITCNYEGHSHKVKYRDAFSPFW